MTPDDPRDPRAHDAGHASVSRDELASALVDGELDAEQAAAARRRPEVVARATAMEEARRALRDRPVPSHPGRDAALAAALAAFDDETATAGGTGPDDAPTGQPRRLDAGPRGDRRTPAGTGPAGSDPRTGGGRYPGGWPARRPVGAGRSRRRPRRWLAPAAVVALMLGLVGLVVATSGQSGDEDMAGDATASQGGSAEHDDGDGSGERATGDEPAASASPDTGGAADAGTVADLGAFATVDALADRVADLLARDGEAADQPLPLDPAPGGAGHLAASCFADPPPALADAVRTVLRGRATVDQRPVEVWVVDTAEEQRLVALAEGCAVVVDRPLPRG